MVHIIGTSLHARIWRLAILACCMLAGLVAVLAWTQELALEANARVEHTHEVRVVLGAYGRAYLDAETGQRGYLLTQKADYLLPYQQALAGNKALLAQLRALLGNDLPPATLRDLAAVFDDKLQEIAQTVQLAQAGNMAGALALVRAGRGRHDTLKFQQLSAQIAATENGLLAVRQAAAQQEEARVLGIVGVGGLLAVIFILAAARQTIIRIEAPLGDLLEGMAALAQGDLQRRVRWQSQDEISQVVAAFNDMADRLAAANLARARSDALVASSTDAIISKDLDGIVTSWNPAAERMFGYSAPEMLGYKLTRLIPPDRVGEETQILATVRAGGTLEHFETVRRRKNGELFSISVSISPVKNAAGQIVGASKIARDITRRKQLDAELQQHREHLETLVAVATAEVNAIVQYAATGIVTIDEGGVIQVLNPAAEKHFGWSKAEVAGKKIAVLMAAPPEGQAEQDWNEFIRTAQGTTRGAEGEVLARRKDAGVFPAHLALGHAEIAEGRHFFVGFITDISEQKRNERRLSLAKEAAEAGARAKAAFVANMSHEIRTPMNAILGFTEIVLQDPRLSPQAAQHVRIILGSAKALLRLINDILDVSRLESGKFALETVAFHLPNALSDALCLVDHAVAEKGLSLVMEYDAGLPLRCLGDPTRLRQVVLNLVGNALKFTAQGGVTLRVKPGDAADMVHFAIADTGIGMTPQQIASVFEPFTQADASTTRRFGGTGLGTAISKQIAELMDGKIWVESEYGQGSVFHFTALLPPAPAGAACLYEAGSTIAEDYVSPMLFKVLLVEDIETNAKLAMLRLKQQGHQVVWRKNGREAVAAFAAGNYDVILMDVMMPEMNGLEATREIRRREEVGTRRIPIIALTASVMREDYDLCVAAGMDGVQAKPIDFSSLLAAMERIVPVGQGQANTLRRFSIAAPVAVDFSPLDGIADAPKALKTWRDPLAYVKALVGFAAEHAGIAVAMEDLLLADCGSVEPARELAHALKGVAGNLCLGKVAESATKIDAALKSGRRKAAIAELGRLRWLLAEAIGAIGKLPPDGQDPKVRAKIFEPEVAFRLFGDLVAKLEDLNPDTVEPILAHLAEYLPKTDLQPIQNAFDAFDFHAAKSNATELAGKLGLKVG